jgi:hypothetical protein
MSVPNVVNALWINAVDAENYPAAGMWTTQDQTQLVLSPYTGLVTATQALSCTAIYAAMVQRRKSLVASTRTGPYSTSFDQAVMVLQSNNSAVQIIIPGPIAAIFKSDNFTVDLENTLVQDWWTEVQAVLGDSIGSPWTQLKHGYRRNIAGL